MKKTKWLVAALAAMVMAAAFAASPKFPSYLIMDGTIVAGVKNQKKLPAELVIPEGATAIGWSAFENCTSLESVTIPEGMTTIGGNAFSGCTSLASVTISVSVTTIVGGAFRDCISLVSMTVPSSVTAIGDDAFKGCASLKKVQFGGTTAQWKAIQGSGNVNVSSIRCSDGYIGVKEVPEYLKMEGTKVTGYTGKVPASLVIPDGVTAIGNYAFRDCTSLASVTIPASVTAIGEKAFNGCTSLASVTIPTSVTAIGDDAFKGCASLKEIQFKGTVAQWEEIQRDGAIPIGVRCSDGNIAAEVVPNLKMDGTVVTGYTGTLPAKLVIPMGVTEIGSEAFKNCPNIESVTIPSSVKKIGSYYGGAFSGCTSLKEIQFKGTKAQWEAIQESKDVKAPYIRFSDGYIGVKEVPAYLKMEGTKVTGYTGKVPANLVIPDGVTGIGREAFKNCTSLESVTIPASVTYADSAFVGCTYLERVTIADGVTKISSSMFSGCTSLKSVSIPGSVKEIESSAFSGCAGLTSIIIPDSVTKIGGGAFSGCASLKSVTIPDSVTGELYAFSGCTSLESVTIGNGVTKIGGFSGCTSLRSVTIPDSVTRIGWQAFENCTSLQSVKIADSVTEIGIYAFDGCTSLKSVTISKGVTKLEECSFRGCKSLVNIVIPRGVAEIDNIVFNACTSLTSVSIPRSVTKIGPAAFEQCSPNLKIQYDGTKAQWNAISKGWWNYPKIGTFVVQCTDGVLTEK